MILNSNKSFTPAEVAPHNNRKDCWIIVGDGVFDVTPYLHKHPGGAQLIMNNAGKDATRDFEGMFHSKGAKLVLERYRVGMLAGRKPTNSLRTFGMPTNQRAASSPSNRTGPYGLGPNPYANVSSQRPEQPKTGPYGLGPNPYANGGSSGGTKTGPYGLGPNPYAKKSSPSPSFSPSSSSSSSASSSSIFKKPLPGKKRDLGGENAEHTQSHRSSSSPTPEESSPTRPQALLKYRRLDTSPTKGLFVTPPEESLSLSLSPKKESKEIASWEEEEDFIDLLFDEEDIFRNTLLKDFPIEGKGEGRMVELMVKKRKQITHNVFLLDLALPPIKNGKKPHGFEDAPEEEVNLLPGFHIAISAKIEKEVIKRNYTPLCVRKNQIELLIKFYEKGTLTPLLNSLKVGDTVPAQIPFVTRGILPSNERVHFDVAQDWDHICLISGGTGITAVYQYLKYSLLKEGKEKSTGGGEGGGERKESEFYLWNCNKTREDMLLLDELVDLVKNHSKRFHLKINITQPTEKEEGEGADTGYSTHYNRFTSSDFEQFFPKPSNKVGVLICGPIPFNESVQKVFLDLGFKFVFSFS